jgi:hypothetical protein
MTVDANHCLKGSDRFEGRIVEYGNRTVVGFLRGLEQRCDGSIRMMFGQNYSRTYERGDLCVVPTGVTNPLHARRVVDILGVIDGQSVEAGPKHHRWVHARAMRE